MNYLVRRNHRKRAAILFLFTIFPFFFIQSADALPPLTVNDIASNLACQCGCSMLVSVCEGVMSCHWAGQAKETIQTMINKGKSKEAIIGYFVSLYGEKVLASPTKRGFNLTAWIIPLFSFLLGGFLITRLILRWSRKKTSDFSDERNSKGENRDKERDQTYLNILEKELKELE